MCERKLVCQRDREREKERKEDSARGGRRECVCERGGRENKSFKMKRGFSLTSNMNYGVQ